MSEETLVKESISTELDALKAVYVNELTIEEVGACGVGSGEGKSGLALDEAGDSLTSTLPVSKFSVSLLPSTAEEKTEQFVALTLRFEVPSKYPDEIPTFEIKSPRGLSDCKIDKIKSGLIKLAEGNKGSNMLSDLIAFAKESLTSFNFPSGKCMICLYEFTREDVFVMTDCYHHFHCRCLAEYIQSVSEAKLKEELELKEMESVGIENKKDSGDATSTLMACPVCRVDTNLKSLLTEPIASYPPSSLSKKPIADESEILEGAKQHKEKFASMFEKQQQQGGIIDEEAEKNKFLLRISEAQSGSGSAPVVHSSPNKSMDSMSSSDVEVKVSLNGEGDGSRDANCSKDSIALLVKSSSIKEANENVSSNEQLKGDKSSPKLVSSDNISEKSIDAKIVNGVSAENTEHETSKTSSEECPSNQDMSPSKEIHNESECVKTNVEVSTIPASNKENEKPTKTALNVDNGVAKPSKAGGRRRRQRSRTKSGGQVNKSEGETTSNNNSTATAAAASGGGQRRNRSRPHRQSNGYSAERPFRAPRGGRGRGRGGRGRGVFINDQGLSSPPYRRNFGNYYNEPRFRRDNFNNRGGDYYDNYRERASSSNRDRPGYYAARVFRPDRAVPTKSESVSSTPAAATTSDSVGNGQAEETSFTSHNYAPRSNGGRRRRRRGGYSRNRNASERFSESENFPVNYDSTQVAPDNYATASTATVTKPRQQNAHGYGSYGSNYYRQGNFVNQRTYYDNGTSSGYNYERFNGYGRQFGYSYNYYSYPRGVGGGGGSNGGASRGNRRASVNGVGGYRSRNRSDTNRSQGSVSKTDFGVTPVINSDPAVGSTLPSEVDV